MTFDGIPLWGSVGLRERGPVAHADALKEEIPGVDGYRVYKLRKDSVVWVCTGRLVAFNEAGLEALLWLGANIRLNMDLGVFVSKRGTAYDNCQLVSYEPAGDAQGCTLTVNGGQVEGVTQVVTGVVSWAAPHNM